MRLNQKLSKLVKLHRTHRFTRFRTAISPFSIGRYVRYRTQPPLIVIVGSPHKVGSTWLFQMLETLLKPQYDFEGLVIPRSMRTRGYTDTFTSASAANFVSSSKGRWLFKTHKNIHPDILPICKFVSVHRDLRDACVSMVHFGTHLPTEAGGYQQEIKQLPFKERLHFELERDYNLERAEYWWNFPATARVHYEHLKNDCPAELHSVARALNIENDYCAKQYKHVAERHDFSRVSQRAPGKEVSSAFLRKGIVGDWREKFEEEHIQHFKTALNGRWNKLLIQMGYEEVVDW
ncbi:sulfotransferase domain-containing protein [Rhodopirellula sallentina]|uniref:Sulfotransferase n=1 Tax=Rhodopirellula sallentina SM41 TaxID=1263870 RepID=M5UF59_9BACT|nr:sulfotransferase domain-containing protein [Rhodopirellula sallentina]EMI56481.1 sulfotransferase [Rhodopirellula sallentina SM41]